MHMEHAIHTGRLRVVDTAVPLPDAPVKFHDRERLGDMAERQQPAAHTVLIAHVAQVVVVAREYPPLYRLLCLDQHGHVIPCLKQAIALRKARR